MKDIFGISPEWWLVIIAALGLLVKLVYMFLKKGKKDNRGQRNIKNK